MDFDFNHRVTKREAFANAVNAHLDRAMLNRQAKETPRDYLGVSGLGRKCERQIQYDYAGAPKDEGAGFKPQTLRWFEDGHIGEDTAARWFKDAGFDLRTVKPDGRQFGFSAADGRFRGHIDGSFASGPDLPGITYPCLWEHKRLGAKSWREVVKKGVIAARPVYAVQIALYQAYLDLTAPAVFTATNRDTLELHHEAVPFDAALAQEMSDRAARIITATDAHELLPRGFSDPAHFECRMCAWPQRCWA